MLPAAEERTPALTSVEEIFSLAAGVALAALDMHQGAREAQGKKPHQGIFSKKRALRVSPMWAKWSGTHQDRKCSWSETVSGSALDANGNTLSDPSGKSYTWDFENRLTQAVVPGRGRRHSNTIPSAARIQKSGTARHHELPLRWPRDNRGDRQRRQRPRSLYPRLGCRRAAVGSPLRHS